MDSTKLFTETLMPAKAFQKLPDHRLAHVVSYLTVYIDMYIYIVLLLQWLHAGMNKMVINHLEKLFVTNNAATVIRELEVSTIYIILLLLTRRSLTALCMFRLNTLQLSC